MGQIVIKKKKRFCLKCYSDEVYFVEYPDNKVMMKCSKCHAYIKWATKEEYEGKEIIRMLKPKKLF